MLVRSSSLAGESKPKIKFLTEIWVDFQSSAVPTFTELQYTLNIKRIVLLKSDQTGQWVRITLQLSYEFWVSDAAVAHRMKQLHERRSLNLLRGSPKPNRENRPFFHGRTHLSGVVVPQLLVQPVGVSFLPLDLSNHIENLRVGAAGAAASVLV